MKIAEQEFQRVFADVAARMLEHGERLTAGGAITPDDCATLFRLTNEMRGVLAALKGQRHHD